MFRKIFNSKIERRKRVTALAKLMYASPLYSAVGFDKCLLEAEEIIEKEDKYIEKGKIEQKDMTFEDYFGSYETND